MANDLPKATAIRVELDDGTILTAQGEHAAEVWQFWGSCEVLAYVHGCTYQGKPLESSKA